MYLARPKVILNYTNSSTHTAYLVRGQESGIFLYLEEIEMFEIKGSKSTAKCFAMVVEDEAIAQIKRMCDYDFTEGSNVRIMPDVQG